MVYNAMYPIGQRPYFINNNRNSVKKKEDEESSTSASAQETQSDEQQALQQKDDNSSSEFNQQSSGKNETYSIVDTAKKNPVINIAQILKDYKNTSNAIGSPPELESEVDTYLELVKNEVKKDEPNTKIVRSNLKNAAILLDNYIAETLQRPSKVVENWAEALFLQQIEYKYDEEEVNPQFLVKFPEGSKNKDVSENENVQLAEKTAGKDENTQAATPSIKIPDDAQLKNLFIKAKKLSYSKDYDKAMETFQQALHRAQEVEDKETESKVLFEIGQIYDKNDYLSQALTSYNDSLQKTEDVHVKTKAHYSMAQIYDDVNQLEPAVSHYICSVSYAGESENLAAQSNSLTKIGNIFSDQYKKDAFEYYSEAQNIASESKDAKTKGYVSSCLGNAYVKFNDPQNALKSFSSAVKDYQEAESPQKVAVNYKKAADVMLQLNNTSKAKTLLEKALKIASQTDNSELVAEINSQLSSIS